MTYDPEAAALIRAQAAEIERLKATYTPGHTDMMVSPESLDAWLEDNPLPAPQPAPVDLAAQGDLPMIGAPAPDALKPSGGNNAER